MDVASGFRGGERVPGFSCAALYESVWLPESGKSLDSDGTDVVWCNDCVRSMKGDGSVLYRIIG